MRNLVLPYLLLPVFLAFSLTANASSLSVDSPPVISLAEAALTSPVNINQADVQILQKALSGIGQAKAQAIVDYRESHGPFTSVDELLEIKGIGKSLLERNRDKLVVE